MTSLSCKAFVVCLDIAFMNFVAVFAEESAFGLTVCDTSAPRFDRPAVKKANFTLPVDLRNNAYTFKGHLVQNTSYVYNSMWEFS